MQEYQSRRLIKMAIIVAVIVAAIVVVGTMWMGSNARNDTESAVRSVSLLYLDELAGRREQVVANNLQGRIGDIEAALELLTPEDLQDEAHLQAYQARMKRLFLLERFAFVDEDGLIHTSTGIQTDLDQYPFDYRTMEEAEISIKNLESTDKRVIIAVPTGIAFAETTLRVCFMEIAMDEMLSGVSMQAQEVHPRHSHRHGAKDPEPDPAAEKDPAQGDQYDIHGGEEPRFAHGGVLDADLLQRAGHKQRRAAQHPSQDQLSARPGHRSLPGDLPGEHGDQRQQHHAPEQGPAAQEGEGADIVHTDPLGHEGRAPDQRRQQKQQVCPDPSGRHSFFLHRTSASTR